MQKGKNNFLLNIFEKESGIPGYYKSINYAENGNFLLKPDLREYYYSKSKTLHHITFFPDYLEAKLKSENELYLAKFHLVKGYSIDLSHFQDVDSYLRSQFKKNAKTIRRFVNRLETCLDIEYKLFYGEISKNEYDQLLQKLRGMIVQRFQQRNEESKSLLEWNRTVELTYPLILKKRASIFVIYDSGKPIEIAINYHFQQIMFSYISSYDIDYSKFGLGHVEIYKQLEWCLKNNFNRFEMGWGDLDYKRRWSNHIYNFEQHLFYPKESFPANIKFRIKALIIRMKLYLISKNVHIHVKNLKKRIRRPKNPKGHFKDYEILQMENNSLEFASECHKIDHHLETYSFLKKIINDFLYSSIEHSSTIEVFECKADDTFIIKGLRHAQKVVLKTEL